LILSILRNNSRESLTRISKRTKIPISTIHERIKQNNNRFIKKHTSIINFNALGFSTVAKIMIKVENSSKDGLKDFLLKNTKINSLFKINNGYDFLAEGVFKNLIELEEFMDNVEERFKVNKREVYYIIDDLKREGFLSDPSLVDLYR
jgi:Lrp/AsnC family transcriptional regulator for asnA, asnC and gidA